MPTRRSRPPSSAVWPRVGRLTKSRTSMNRLAPAQRGSLVKLATTWGSKNLEKYGAEAVQSLLAKVQDTKLKTADRLDAARELVGYKVSDKATAEALLDLVSVNTPPEVA